MQFPKGFLWGAATSGPQTEGFFNKPHDSIMDTWFKESPKDFFDGVGPEICSDIMHHYKEDLKMMKQAGFNSWRTSIQWTRLIDDLEQGTLNEEGFKFYDSLIDESHKNGIEIFLNLHHFDMPTELFKKYGGWESKHVVDLYVKFAETAFKAFGKKVKYWITFNEPYAVVECQYLYGHHYPKYKDGKKAMQVTYNLNLASAKAIEAYRKLNLGGKIGTVLNVSPAYPRSDSAEDVTAANIADDICNRSFLYPAVFGYYPQSLVDLLTKDNVLWDQTKEELEILKNNTVDFVGINYYQPRRVKVRESKNPYSVWMPDKYFEHYDKPGIRMNPYRGWEIYPEAMLDMCRIMKDEYKNVPWFVSENGMGVEGEEKYKDESGQINDDYRIDFYKEHLTYLWKGIEEGSNCFGYHTWAALDCWSWGNAYKNRYGFLAVDLKTQERKLKKSAYWYKKLSDTNTLE